MDCVSLVALLFGAYGTTNETERQSMYVMFLNDVPLELLELSIKKLVRESVYLPSIAEIIEMSRNFHCALNPQYLEVSFESVWQEIMLTSRKYGAYQKPIFKYPETAEIVSVFGWHYICTINENQVGVLRSQAEKVFKSNAKQRKEAARNEYYLTGENVLGIPSSNDVLLKIGA